MCGTELTREIEDHDKKMFRDLGECYTWEMKDKT